MTEHTPGPWIDNSKGEIWGEEFICALDARGEYTESSSFDAEVMRANARLIAAAPELLEALAAMLERRPTEEPPNEMGVAHRNWVLFEKGRAAIRKATE